MANIYELTSQYNDLYALFTSGEIDEDTFHDTLDSIDWSNEFEIKIEGYVMVLKQLDADGDAIKSEEKRLSERRKTFENNAERLKSTLFSAMKSTGNEKIKTPLFNINIQKNPPSVVIEDGAAIPDEYLIPQDPKIDKRGLLQAINDGADFKGISILQGESLRIR